MIDRREAIKQAYVETIRNVLILDDRYPDYGKLGDGSDPAYDFDSAYDTASAVRLWQGFRMENRSCNISSARKDISESYLEHTDLLVLDYELDADDQGQKGRTARETLRTLAATTRQNMVIVYTARPDLLEVKLEISVALMGLPACNDLDDTDQEKFEDWMEGDLQEDIDYNNIFSYIRHPEQWRKRATPFIRFEEEHIRRHLRGYVMQDSKQILGRFQVSEAEPHWIRVGSVFISLLNKQPEHTAMDLLNHLTNSLVMWKPSFMRIMLAYARAGIVEQGISGDDRVLRDPETEAAWMFYTDESVNYDERRERVGILYARLVDDLLEHNLDRLINFSSEHGGRELTQHEDPLMNAMRRAGLLDDKMNHDDQSIAERRVIHKINHYLAFERGPGRGLRSGTVFRNQETDEYGVITTPDCDLVPNRNSKSGLGSALRVVYRPAFVVASGTAEAYGRATEFKHMFLHIPSESHDDGYLILGLYHGKPSAHPSAGVVYVADQGLLDSENCFTAQRVIMCPESDKLVIEESHSFLVLAQLRDRYALRLLHEAGHHLSRTGVDFVTWKARPKTKLKPK